jgi:hypothetical protein
VLQKLTPTRWGISIRDAAAVVIYEAWGGRDNPMRFLPSTEEQLAAKNIWPKGIYDFLIVDATEKVSAAGNPMIELEVKITRSDGAAKVLRDYILSKRAAKLLHCASACGVLDKYQSGVLSDDDFVGREGKLKLGIQTSKYWPTKNVVRDYVVKRESLRPCEPRRKTGLTLPMPSDAKSAEASRPESEIEGWKLFE